MSVLRRAPPERLPTAYAHLSRAMEYFHTIRVLDFDPDALACFQTLQKEKLRIGTKDLRIAAVALSQQAILVTRNAKDFSQIPGVNLEDWSIEASA